MRWGQEKQSSCFFQAKTAGTTLRRNLCFNLPRAGFNFVRAAVYARLSLSLRVVCLRVFCLIAKVGVVRTMGLAGAMRSTRISSSTHAGATNALFERRLL